MFSFIALDSGNYGIYWNHKNEPFSATLASKLQETWIMNLSSKNLNQWVTYLHPNHNLRILFIGPNIYFEYS